MYLKPFPATHPPTYLTFAKIRSRKDGQIWQIIINLLQKINAEPSKSFFMSILSFILHWCEQLDTAPCVKWLVVEIASCEQHVLKDKKLTLFVSKWIRLGGTFMSLCFVLSLSLFLRSHWEALCDHYVERLRVSHVVPFTTKIKTLTTKSHFPQKSDEDLQ